MPAVRALQGYLRISSKLWKHPCVVAAQCINQFSLSHSPFFFSPSLSFFLSLVMNGLRLPLLSLSFSSGDGIKGSNAIYGFIAEEINT